MSFDGLVDQFLKLSDPPLSDLSAGWEGETLNLFARRSLDRLEHSTFSLAGEEDGLTFAACSTRSPNSVDVDLSVEGDIVIEDMTDSRHIEPSGRYVGADQDIEMPLLEAVDGALSQLLAHISIEGHSAVSPRLQLLG